MSSDMKSYRYDRGFTLMELMIVLVIIGILMSGVFMLMSVVAKNADVSKTQSRIQKVQNAISGFYAAYGTYPPVELHGTTNPFGTINSDFEGEGEIDGNSLNAQACRRACRAQPVSFEYPYPQNVDSDVNIIFGAAGVMGANQTFNNAATIRDFSWSKVQMFKFGLVSFLLPRIETLGLPKENRPFSSEHPIDGFFRSAQWKHNNKTSRITTGGSTTDLRQVLRSQRQMENREAAKWLPNLEGQIAGYGPTIFNIKLASNDRMTDPDLDGTLRSRVSDADQEIDHHHPFRGPYSRGGGSATVLYCSTLKDAWHRDLYYYSAPPYQSYRLWSAGPDGNTFPPWIPLDSLSTSDRKEVAEWLKDDIVGFDQQ
jgi:prepilin-type N-terminal cleavage/methylation domain-containing protein